MDEVNFLSVMLSSINSFDSLRFSSYWILAGDGFHIAYETMKIATACGGNYSNSIEYISSPSLPNEYPALADCVYLITKPNGTYINIHLPIIEIDLAEIMN